MTTATLLHHALGHDQLMNLIYRHYGPDDGKKPNIYFPNCNSLESFSKKLEKDKLLQLGEGAPLVLDEIRRLQAFVAGEHGWWPMVHKLASIRHETFPQIETREEPEGIGIGGGQCLYIERMAIRSGRIVEFKGAAWNPVTGAREPVRVVRTGGLIAEIVGIGVAPAAFIDRCALEAETFIKHVGSMIP